MPTDASRLSASAAGGFVRPGPAGSNCSPSLEEFSLDLRTQRLSFTFCDARSPNAPYVKVTGAKSLTSAQVATIVRAYGLLGVSQNGACGMDKPSYSVDITSPRGTKTYTDEFYSCMGSGRTYVENIDAPFQAFRSLLPPR